MYVVSYISDTRVELTHSWVPRWLLPATRNHAQASDPKIITVKIPGDDLAQAENIACEKPELWHAEADPLIQSMKRFMPTLEVWSQQTVFADSCSQKKPSIEQIG